VDQRDGAVHVGVRPVVLAQIDAVDGPRLVVGRARRDQDDGTVDVRDLLLPGHAGLLAAQRREVLAVGGIVTAPGRRQQHPRQAQPRPAHGCTRVSTIWRTMRITMTNSSTSERRAWDSPFSMA